MDERLGLAEGQEQGRWREKLALVAVLVPSPQAPPGCQTLLESARHASGLRRVALREAQRLTTRAHRHTFPERARDRISRQGEGQLCPTREPRQSTEEQGYREAKAGVAFSQHDGAEVSKERQEILHQVLQAKITDREDFGGSFRRSMSRRTGSRPPQ